MVEVLRLVLHWHVDFSILVDKFAVGVVRGSFVRVCPISRDLSMRRFASLRAFPSLRGGDARPMIFMADALVLAGVA